MVVKGGKNCTDRYIFCGRWLVAGGRWPDNTSKLALKMGFTLSTTPPLRGTPPREGNGRGAVGRVDGVGVGNHETHETHERRGCCFLGFNWAFGLVFDF